MTYPTNPGSRPPSRRPNPPVDPDRHHPNAAVPERYPTDREVVGNETELQRDRGIITTETVHDRRAYNDGYLQGRTTAERRYEASVHARENDSAARGLLLGVLLTSLVGLAIGAYFLLTQRPTPTGVVVPPVTLPDVNAEPVPSPEVRERIIERDRLIPIPQEVPVPSVTITVPESQPAPQPPAQTIQPAPTEAPQPAQPIQPDAAQPNEAATDAPQEAPAQ